MLTKLLHTFIESIGMRFKLLLFNARPLIIFELLFNVISANLIVPLLFLLLRFAMKITNYPLLTADNFSQFLVNPVTIVFLVLILMIIALVSLVDISAAIFIFECSKEHKKTTLKDTAVFAFQNSIRLIKPKNLLIVFILLVIMPLVNIGVTSSFLSQFHLPSNLYEYFISNPLVSIIAIICLAIIIFLAMKWVFAIHYFTLDKLDFITSVKKSWHLLRGNTIRNFISIMIVQIVIALLTKLLNLSGSFFIHQISATLGERTLVGSFAISIASVAFLAIYLILFAIFLPYSCLKISALFYERKHAANETIVKLDYKGKTLSKKQLHKIKIALAVTTGACVIICTGILYYSQAFILTNPAETIKYREIIAERASLLDSPENTLSAIETAANDGADTICVDVQISTDNIPYLRRSSRDKTFEQIAQTEISTITKNGLQKERIPRLDEAIESAKSNNIGIMLDISTIKYNDNKLDIILSKIDSYADKISIASDKYEDLINLKKKRPDIKTVYNLGSAIGDFTVFEAADTYALDLWCIDTQTADNVHADGHRIIASDVRSNDDIESAMTTKIDGLKTTHVSKAAELNKTRGLPEFMYVFADNIN